MTPTPQEYRPFRSPEEVAPELNGDNVVISGMSGIFPMASSVEEFSKILYKKVNPVSTENSRWTLKHPEVSEYTGKVPDIERFDSQFFMVHNRLGNAMDPMARKVLEHSYQAIYDAGFSPRQLNGKKVGVFIASAFSDMENTGMFNSSSRTGYGITGVSKTMYANRISYWLNAKGPSMTVDDACCGSMVALEEAYTAIKSGSCEAALIGGCNLCLDPCSQVHYNRCIKISPDGKTRSFDKNADGCAKSEAICVLFIQKAKNALRAYAEVVQVKNEFISTLSGETGQIFGFVRNPDTTAAFMKQFYLEAGVSPQEVEYVEACGSATPEADKTELQAIEKVFCDNRTDPLLVGSVISNIGFTDAASGATALTKVLLGYHNGLIAGNLNCETPRQDIAAIREGRMTIVTKNQPFHGSYTAVNCLSVTGVNSHLLLRGFSKPKDLTRYTTPFPRLVTLSARQKAHLQDIFEGLSSRPIDDEELALLRNIHCNNISGHLGRGYVILDKDENQNTVKLLEKMEHADEIQHPLWFVYSGMGSQWTGMGAQLMRIPIFAAAIKRCHTILEPKGVDLVHIITSPDKTIFDNVLNSFVGIAAIQIGLTDVLTALGLCPDKIIGHSVGELGCAYADGCLTAEEMILAAYSRGKASNETPLIKGAMAAVGLGYQELIRLCPPAIEIACHNSPGSSTISGPEKNISEFVAILTSNGVFAKEVPSSNIAYHSRYIADAGPNLLRLLSEIIQKPKARSERWLSTSIPQERWDEPIAKYCSPEYLTNNLLSPVHFEETSRLVPSNAVLIEIAPHGLLQAILKRSLPESCKNIPLTLRGHQDNALFLLDAIGKLYVEGYSPQVQALYPKVEFPVSTGTPHLSHIVKWNHTETWIVSGQNRRGTKTASHCKLLISTHDDEHSYLSGNVVQGKVLYPFAGALMAVWDTLAMTLGLSKKSISVRFFDVHLYSQPIIHSQKQIKIIVALHRGNGQFEVTDGDSKVASGCVVALEETNDSETEELSETFDVSSDELYQNFTSRGYSYRDQFRSILAADESLTTAQIIWNNNWVTLIDGLLQLNALRITYEGVSHPTQIRDLTIDVKKHEESIRKSPIAGQTVIKAKVDEISDCTRCGGVLLQNLKYRNVPSAAQSVFKIISPTLSSNNVNHVAAGKKIALQIDNVGDLDSLTWEETPIHPESGVKVLVEYAGINVSDVKRAMGVIPFDYSEKYYGMDFSGVTERGERVMGLVRNGAASTVVFARPEMLWPIPAHWTLEEAATVPFAYAQAFYYLCVKSELLPGWKVLIHGAAGALGQAAISVALAHGCQVFATVSDNAKKRFLLKLFPQLNEDAIGNSRDDSFGDMVLNATNGEGCKIILSCVREDLKNISLKCAAFSGVTIDMVQIQNRENYDYGMHYMTKQRSYIAADFYSVLDSGNGDLKKLQTLLSVGISRGYVRPLSRVTLPPQEAPRAFRLLAASRHRGRVLLRTQDSLAPAQPRIVCSSDGIHIIFWDGSSFGLQLVDRLITRGATKLRIYCLRPVSTYLLKLRLWKKLGADVEIVPHTLADTKTVFAILNEASVCGPVEGIYVTAIEAVDSKVETVISHLDVFSRVSCRLLKYFAVITVDNNIGEQICISRRKDDLPATALNLSSKSGLSQIDSVLEKSSWDRSAADITEVALHCQNPVVHAQLQAAETPSLYKLLETLSEKHDENATLKDLGMENSVPFVKSFLRDIHHVSLEDEDILMLTKNKILEIEMSTKERNYGEVKGLGVFFSFEDLDELQAATDVVQLNTLVTNLRTLESGMDASKAQLFVIPGLEGHHARFRQLCERLKLPAFVLQPGLDQPDETPQALALRYSKVLLEKYKLTRNFYLLGYECGIFVALELAAILEEHGMTGTVYCIGDGPEEMKAMLEAELKSFETEEALQEGLTRHMFTLMTDGSEAFQEESALRDCDSWSERVDACVHALLGRVSHTAQYTRVLLEAAYARIRTARHYTVKPRVLRSRIVLLRAQRELGTEKETSLQHYSQQAIVVRNLSAPMAHIAADVSVPAIINRYLDDDTLEAYENSNLCETYFY